METYTFAKNFSYRLELHVKDESGSTIFVVFDKEAEKRFFPLKWAIDVDVEIEREVPKAKRNGK